jgi:hypothetical protein
LGRYEEAINLWDKVPANTREQLLLKLAENDNAAGDVASAIIRNFDKLPADVQQLLFKLAENDKTAPRLTKTVLSGRTGKLPAFTLGQLLLKLAENDYSASLILSARDKIELPENIRNKILTKIEERGFR